MTYFGVSAESRSSPQYSQSTAVIVVRPIMTGIIVLHLPLAPSFRMMPVEMKMPNMRTPLKAVSGAPLPNELSPSIVPLERIVKQSAPPVT